MISTTSNSQKNYWEAVISQIASKLKLVHCCLFLAGSADGLLRFWENGEGKNLIINLHSDLTHFA